MVRSADSTLRKCGSPDAGAESSRSAVAARSSYAVASACRFGVIAGVLRPRSSQMLGDVRLEQVVAELFEQASDSVVVQKKLLHEVMFD